MPDAMKVVILDHNFEQDIEALQNAVRGRHVVRTISPSYFASLARRYFPADVWEADLSVYHDERYRDARARYRAAAVRRTFELHALFPFDVFVAPSDTFFYIRDVIDACHMLGVPFVVVQKELGVSARSLESHAGIMKRWFPFKGDWMTTCSEASKRFWVAAGADPEHVSVVGQPRFDYYVTATNSTVNRASTDRHILFLSYDLDAYDEHRGTVAGHAPWRQMHLETEAVLRRAAEQGAGRVFVKPHPQQDAAALEAMIDRLGGAERVTMLPRSADTRRLITDADVVVGFQTTAIAEAMLANKQVVYTMWGERVNEVLDMLLPFHTLDGSIEVARSPEELLAAIVDSKPRILTPAQVQRREAFVTELFGPADGRAAERVWDVVAERVGEGVAPVPPELPIDVGASTPVHHEKERRAATRRLRVRQVAASLAGRIMGDSSPVTIGLRSRVRDERDRVRECREAAIATFEPTGRLVGSSPESLAAAGWRVMRRFFAR